MDFSSFIYGDIFAMICFIFVLFVGFKTGRFIWAGKQGYSGKLIIETSENGNKLFTLELNGSPEELESKSSVSFKVIQTIT